MGVGDAGWSLPWLYLLRVPSSRAASPASGSGMSSAWRCDRIASGVVVKRERDLRAATEACGAEPWGNRQRSVTPRGSLVAVAIR